MTDNAQIKMSTYSQNALKEYELLDGLREALITELCGSKWDTKVGNARFTETVELVEKLRAEAAGRLAFSLSDDNRERQS